MFFKEIFLVICFQLGSLSSLTILLAGTHTIPHHFWHRISKIEGWPQLSWKVSCHQFCWPTHTNCWKYSGNSLLFWQQRRKGLSHSGHQVQHQQPESKALSGVKEISAVPPTAGKWFLFQVISLRSC